MMRPDSIAREEAVFGNDFVEHYGGTREHEVKLWNEAVTNWEAGGQGDKRQQAMLLPIKGDKAGKTEAPATAKRRRA